MSSTVSVVASSASLLSGGLDECFNITDASCQGGFAAVSALVRSRTEPTLVLPKLDKSSPFVQMHPLKWAVNLLILHGLFAWNLFVSSPSILTAGNVDLLSSLQSTSMPLLLTNVVVPPSSSWNPFHEIVHFDSSTSLAVLSIADNDQTNNWPQVESTAGALEYIARVNAQGDCEYSSNIMSLDVLPEGGEEVNDVNCWIPVVYYADTSQERLETFVSAITSHDYAPALIIDVENGHPNYTTPVKVKNTWVYSYQLRSDAISIVTLEKSNEENQQVTDVTVTDEDLGVLSEQVKDRTFASHLEYLRTLADEAEQNDPVVGETGEMPAIRYAVRKCVANHCASR